MAEPATCAACSAAIDAEEIAEGLAVKVSGRLLCPLCLEHLPAESKVLVNQMRALRGMAVTTYRFFSGRHPGLPLYTFTTAAMMLAHRRKLVHDMPFEAPPLPPPGSRPRLPTAAEAARGERTGWIAVAGIAVLIATGIVWLAIPGAPKQKPKPAPPPTPVVAPPPPPLAPVRSAAAELNDLVRRLAEHPEQAQAVSDAAELLRDALPPRELDLRRRADDLAREAAQVAERNRPAPPAPAPPIAQPEPAPQPGPETPVALPEPKPPVAQPEPPVALPEPKPPVAQPEPKPPVVQPEPPVALPEPEPPKEPKQPKPPKSKEQAVVCAVTVLGPKGVRVLCDADAVPRGAEVPWPWPSGVAIHAAAPDARSKPRRHAIDLRLPGVGAAGGAAIVVHPVRQDRKQIQAIWQDDTTSAPPIAITLTGQRWQTIAVPATGVEALDAGQLHLRLEDASGELAEKQPFLVGGAATRSATPPAASDLAPGLPLLLPAELLDVANGWTTYRTALRKRFGKLVEDRQFAFAKAKVLVPKAKDFQTDLRRELAALRGGTVPDGNPADLPAAHKDFANPLAGWPDDMDDLGSYSVAVLGWRAETWGGESDLARRLDNLLLNKVPVAEKKVRRPAVVPLLLLGEVNFASAAERAEIDRLWLPQAVRLAGYGVPVIDLRSAQQEDGTEQIRKRACELLADGLRQLDWMNRL